ncbi:SRPBCC family protein [Telmatocola sphagniphila]|uniref:SRPBCC family protein n=1 Tax=Telmatocola sphagniphila TaxID=1123043 RepID=A0A8E6B312_9BACT|nr:SRPBCC family protein [Telmatocola sphagniphila]QVL30369.1 SRPBCC family protein [Telmatocola sphagniphila]
MELHTSPTDSEAPRWARRWLWVAGWYNLIWGTLTILFPNLLFDLVGIPRLNYPEIWQCVGMIVGVYGVGYLIAAGDPHTHWPIVLVGLLGKIFGPIGFAFALFKGTFPPLFGLTILTNDLIWWVPFTYLIWDAMNYRGDQRPSKNALQHFIRESRIAATPETVFQFHESPEALEKLIPPWENMKVSESAGSLKPGSRVVLAGKSGPIPMRWVALHTEYEPPRMFADQQLSGPFAWWYHRHEFIDDGAGGTILRDNVEYVAPMGAVGRILGGWLVRRKLAKMFTYRHQVTRQIVESGTCETSAQQK